MTELPVREMVLYKHGVGFFVRTGAVSGEKAALTFRQDEINDVLKSLAVFDVSGGQVLGLHYQTPMDKEARLASSSIRLANHASVRDLLRDLRGRTAALDFETAPGTIETITGRIIGLDDPSEMRHNIEELPDALISILAENGTVRVFKLDSLRGIQIQDSQSEHDLSYFLDTSMSEDDRRMVNVRLSEGDHELVVHYVAPSPTWRVSYRIVAESDDGGETGKALLQGWGLFDNRLEEDLEDVQVTLVAGQPISFIYELYASRIPKRPTVQDESRIAPGPIEFEGATRESETQFYEESLAAEERISAAPRFMRAAGGAQVTRAKMGLMAEQSTPAQAQTKESGEFFQYIVSNPVSVKRGESALVPIIGSEIKYNRELLYNGKKLPKHPVAAMRFDNTTGLTLERGPVTVVEDNDYKGEAVVPFTKDNNEVYLPYAVELGIQITEKNDSRNVTVGLNVDGAFLKFDMYHLIQITYTVENKTAKNQAILIESAITPGYVLVDTPTPTVETATDYRWKINSPAHRKTEFTKIERRRTESRSEIRKLTYKSLQNYLENRWLDKALFDELNGILDMLDNIRKIQVERGQLEAERITIYQKQEQLRANLQTLQPTGQEANLRNRMLQQLEATQNRLEEIDRTLIELTQLETATEKQIEDSIAALN